MTSNGLACLLAGLLLLATLAVPALADGDTGLVRVSSSPGGALVYIDDTYRGVTPIPPRQSPAIEVAANTQHTLRLIKKGYRDYTTTFSVDAGQLRDVTGTLSPVGPTPVFGTIAVRSSPGGAAVYIDGTYHGTTPVQSGSWLLREVPAGRHRVSIQLDGYTTHSTTVDVATGERREVEVTLDANRPGGSIRVSTGPIGATVVLDGKDVRTAPATFANVAPGLHMVVATRDGYEPLSRSVQVNSGETAQVTLILSRVSASIGSARIRSVPTGADVYLDGVYRGWTPITIENLGTGGHDVLLLRSGYRDYSTTVTIGAGATAELQAALTVQPSSTGSVDVVSYPAGAAVYLDGAYRGQTNPWDALDIPGVALGEHDLTVSLDGYHDHVTIVTVTAGGVANAVATLVDLPGANPNGQVAVVSMPAGAGVYLDGIYRGLTPLTATAVPTGMHTLLVRAAGHQDWATAVQVNEGETAQVSATLFRDGAAMTTSATVTPAAPATTATPTPTTAAPTPTRSGPGGGLALAGCALAGLLVLRARR